jgi:ubiquinone/menaquinone biosynthesis C-methylase UbiE
MTRGYDQTTDVIRHHWDRRAGTFDAEAGHGMISDKQRRAWLALLSRIAGPAPQRVLDVGCGTGFLALGFAELGHTVTGIDLSPHMIDRARHKAEEAALKIDFRAGDAFQLDFPNQTYTLVIARHVIWNLPDPRRAVAEWLRVLRPGGRLALIEGKWADNEALQRSNLRLASRILARAIDIAAALALHTGRHPTKVLNRRYRQLEVDLPFSGGPPAARLAEFLKAHSLHEVAVEPLMDPALWDGPPEFPRYLVTGLRAPQADQADS